MYQISIPKHVKRQLEDLPGHIRQRVKREIAKLASDPRPKYAQELRSNLRGRYKIKLDQYRIVYRIDDEAAIVRILKTGKKHFGFYDDLE